MAFSQLDYQIQKGCSLWSPAKLRLSNCIFLVSALPEALLLMRANSRSFWKVIPYPPRRALFYSWASSPHCICQLFKQIPKRRKGRRAAGLRGSPLMFWEARPTDRRQPGASLVWDSVGNGVRGSSVSTALQNATDRVTESVNIAAAYDLHGSLNTQHS